MSEIKATLLTAPGCPHCGSVKQALTQLQSEEPSLVMEIIDISEHPDIADSFAVRSVPWLQLGMFELAGSWSLAELRHWLKMASSEHGMREYLGEMLGTGQLVTAERVLRRFPQQFPVLLQLLVDNERDINVHIGVSALLEGMRGEKILVDHIQDIAALTTHEEARVRADACHFLMLTGDDRAVVHIRALCDDSDAEVREIATESLEELLGESN